MTTMTKPKPKPRWQPSKLRAFLGELRDNQAQQPTPRMLYDITRQEIVFK